MSDAKENAFGLEDDESAAADESTAAGELPAEEPDDAGVALEGDDPGESADEALEELVRSEYDTLSAERDEYLDALRRLQADFDNYRKRALRQQTDLLERAAEQLITKLLPVLDALDLAEAHGPEEADGGSLEAEALTQIGTLLRGTLEREGLERIDAVGVGFDPTVHDAVAHEEEDETDEGEGVSGPRVSEVMRAGYRLKGRVLRPAMVKVTG